MRFMVGMLVAGSVLAVGTVAEANGRHYNNESTIEVELPNWMSWVADDTPLSAMSIPGTHDSGALNGGDSPETQEVPLRGQLDAGVRALDIRARHIEDVFTIHHGPIYQDSFCDDPDEGCGTFGAVLREIGGFLAENPTETILMRLGDSGVPGESDTTRSYSDTFEWYRDSTTYGRYIWDPPNDYTGEIPDLGDVRGKILILKDFDGGSRYGMTWDSATRMSIQDEYVVPTIFDIGDKWDHAREHFELTETGTDDLLYVNHLSGASSGAYPNAVAGGSGCCIDGVNERAMDYLFEANQDRTTGVVMMDFPGSGLIAAIVGHNFPLADPADFSGDWTEVAEHVAYSADGDDGGEARDHGQDMAAFMRHITPQRFIHLFATKQTWAVSWNNDGLFASVPGDHDMDFVLAGTKSGSAEVDTSSAAFQSWYQGVIDGISDSANAGNRRTAIRNALDATYPGAHWMVVVSGGDGGFENWYYTYYGSGQRIDQDDYRHVVWNVRRNDPPVADAGGPYVVPEGSSVTLTAAGSTDPDGDTLQYRWDLDGNGTYDTSWSPSATASFSGVDDASLTVRVQVSDGEFTSTDTAAVTVTNVAPTITATATDADENSPITLSGTITDPSPNDTFTVTIDWGDGTTNTLDLAAGTTTYTHDHTYPDDNPTSTPNDDYTITVTATDDDTGTTTQTTTTTVTNVAPELAVPAFTDETGAVIGTDIGFVFAGLEVGLASTFTDIGPEDTHTATVDWGDGTLEVATVVQGSGTGSLSASHVWAAGSYTVVTTVTDDDTGQDSESVVVEVLDAADGLVLLADLLVPLGDDPALDPAAADLVDALYADLVGENGGAAANGAVDKLTAGQGNAGLVRLGEAVAVADELLVSGSLSAEQTALVEQVRTSMVLAAKSAYVELVDEIGAPPQRSDVSKLADGAAHAAAADAATTATDAIAHWTLAVRVIEPLAKS